ncbi:hypothetical protein DYB30_001833 [Aphanomyces astaci]|uniref:Uncharacterized protein n=1 Tax=Aphanomyces astaci TaxID=112090 RepID=A0A397DGE1_APHAT|nr:hypothetical protein DYB30_001833 [Aphanomyces astaci]
MLVREARGRQSKKQQRRRPVPLLDKLVELPVARPQTHAVARHPVAKIKEAKRRGLTTAAAPRTRAPNQDNNNPHNDTSVDDPNDKSVRFKLAWRNHVATSPVKKATTHVAVVASGVASLATIDAPIPFFPVQLLQQVHVNLSMWTLVATDTAFLKIAAHNNRLRNLQSSLALAECAHLEDWVLVRAFYNFERLTHVNLSACITDNTIKAMALRCRHLIELDLSSCPQVDKLHNTGIVYLAEHCVALERLSLASIKAQFNERITDLALLSCGEHCPRLQGCPALTSLDMTHCLKLTDVAMRALGSLTPHLQTLYLGHAKNISDVGLRFLSDGCPRLSLLHLKQLYLVSDGVKREFGLEGLQARSLHSIGTHCTSLKKINLRGCVSATSVGLSYVLQGCASLVHVNFTAIEQCTNAVVQEIAKCCAALKELILAQCVRVTDSGLRYLHRLSNQLVGCGISTRVLSSLKSSWKYTVFRSSQSEMGYFPTHRAKERRYMDESGQLCLAAIKIQVPPVDTSPQPFISLVDPTPRYRAVRGARVAQVAMKAQKRWTKKRHEAATKMQRRWRGIDGRRKFKLAKAMREADRQDETASATQLQSLMRGRQARKVAAARRQAELDREVQRQHAAIRLQCMYRQRIARRKFRARLDRLAETHRAATKMQCAWRARQGRSIMGALRMARDRREHEAAATLVQLRWKKRVAYKSRVWEAEMRRSGNVARRGAASRLQLWWRNHIRRPMYNYYHKRIEYGDGEFPSVWPSEIDQDRNRPWDFINHVPLEGYDALAAWIAEEDMRLYLLRLALQKAEPVEVPEVVEEVVQVVEVVKPPRAFDEDSSGNKIVFKPVGCTTSRPDEDVAYQVKVDAPSDYSDKATKKSKRKRRPLAAQKKLLNAATAKIIMPVTPASTTDADGAA